MKNGLLIINLGTPDAPDQKAVRRYLAEFLADERVITLPTIPRYFLLYGLILPFRPKQTAHAYQAIWTDKGSPLLIHSEQLRLKLQTQLGDEYQVALGMRYGNPTIENALKELESCKQITILPLYPQYSSAATGSSIEHVLNLIAKQNIIPTIKVIRDFHNHPGFIDAMAKQIKPYLANHEHLLLSYHGIPENHILTGACKTLCVHACANKSPANSGCYRAQCQRTSQALANELSLSTSQYSVSFQSRLGRTPWIKPYTDQMLISLREKGVKHLAVACPAFVADCLETLEEIGIRAKADWLKSGGEELTLIPCVNDSESWVNGIISIINAH